MGENVTFYGFYISNLAYIDLISRTDISSRINILFKKIYIHFTKILILRISDIIKIYKFDIYIKFGFFFGEIEILVCNMYVSFTM